MKVNELIKRLEEMPQDAEVQMDIDWTTAPIGNVVVESDGMVVLELVGR